MQQHSGYFCGIRFTSISSGEPKLSEFLHCIPVLFQICIEQQIIQYQSCIFLFMLAHLAVRPDCFQFLFNCPYIRHYRSGSILYKFFLYILRQPCKVIRRRDIHFLVFEQAHCIIYQMITDIFILRHFCLRNMQGLCNLLPQLPPFKIVVPQKLG